MHSNLENLALVALGSLVGAPARYFISGLIARRFGETFPWGTLAVNTTGCFAIGLLGAIAATYPSFSGAPWQFAVGGALGSFTTVSSFSLQTLNLARDREFGFAGRNVLLSLLFCLSAVALGYFGASALLGQS